MSEANTLTLRQLRTLAAIADHGTLSAAAEALGLTPPAVHSQLKLLEEIVGCSLVHRGGGTPARLTGEGQLLADAKLAIDTAIDRALRQIHARREGLAGAVVLGVVSTAKYFAPGLVALLQQAFPDIEVTLKVGNRDEIIAMLNNNAVDLVIMGRPPRVPAVTASVIGEHPHVIIAPPGHCLLTAAEISAEELLRERFITREPGSGTRILMTRYLDQIGQGQPYRTIEMGSNETIKQAVIAGLGIALISRHTVMAELQTGRLELIAFPGLPIIRFWYLMHAANRPPAQAAATVHDFILAQNAGFLPGTDEPLLTGAER